MIYYIIGLISALTIFALILFLLFKNRIISLKSELKFTQENYANLYLRNTKLEQEKLEFITEIQRLQSKVEHLTELNKETERVRQAAADTSKAALVDLGNNLSKQLIELHKKETKESRELSEKNIETTAKKFHNEFERLVSMIASINKDAKESKETVDLIKQSLLSPTSAGSLAEITLENILTASNLRKDLDFILQQSVLNDDQSKLRPDAVIFLPGGNLMIVDAKASKFLATKIVDMDDSQQKEGLAKTMNLHLKSLSGKDYAENVRTDFFNKGKANNNIVTLMFLPTEHAVERIMEADPNFIHKAWSLNVFPVGPTGLMNMLSFAKFQITDSLRNENHKQIIDEVKKLLTTVSNMTEHANKIGSNIQSLVSNYDKFAGSFNRNFLSRTKNMQRLGIELPNKVSYNNLERYELVSSRIEVIEADTFEEDQNQPQLILKDGNK